VAQYVAPTAESRPPPAIARRAARQVALSAFSTIRHGLVTVVEPSEIHVFGEAGDDELNALVQVHDDRAYTATVARGTIGLGESYFRGHWDTDDLPSFLRILLRNTTVYDVLERAWSRIADPVFDRFRRSHLSEPERDRANIHAHYDLGNDFFELFLDETMTYSCAYFESPDTSLAKASRAKLDRLCRRIDLQPGDEVLEIGTGWGSFAEHAAANYGCRVTTTTIADEQYAYTAERIDRSGLADQVTVLDRDYRELDGEYDKIVSIEMIEAVDWRDYDAFFSTCDRLLRPDGAMGLQAITVPDHRFRQRRSRTDFTKRYIFPGGCIPSLAAIEQSVRRVTDLTLVRVEDIGLHYGETLARWRQRLRERSDEINALGLDRSFRRMWEFYLAMCEAGFRERYVRDHQVVLAKT
jgi:cyclopropane-fatty-acyl-phospholipid synthase